MAGSPDEKQQHTADDEQRTDRDGCQRGYRAAFLGVLLFPFKQIKTQLLHTLTDKLVTAEDQFTVFVPPEIFQLLWY